jgi:hypothetical protein
MSYYATSFKLAGTKSFRLSSTKLLSHYGGNSQNPPPALCRCIQPSAPNRSFVQPDQSGAESLIVAMESGSGLYRRILSAGIKQHSYIALHAFIDEFRRDYSRERYWRKEPTELKALIEWPELYNRINSSGSYYALGKMTNHARSYRMKWPTFQIKVLTDTEGKIVLDNREAKELLETWDQLFPEVLEWQALVEDQVRKHRTLSNLFGFPRTFYGRMNDELIREAISWIPQSTVGCITHYAVIGFQKYCESHDKKSWWILNNKHDSYLAECPDRDIEECAKVMKACIENQELTSSRGEKFRMKAGVSIGKNWEHYDKDRNPLGMKEL